MATVVTSENWFPYEIEPAGPDHEHDWIFWSHDHVMRGPHIHTYACKCGAWMRNKGLEMVVTEHRGS